MSDEEDVVQSEEEGSEDEQEGQSEAQLAMQKRRQEASHAADGIDESAAELLENNRAERVEMEAEIRELRERSERRKREREEEEKRMAEKRSEEEARRKAEEDERRRKKEEEESTRHANRAAKMAEFEKWKNPPKPNFVITRKAGGDDESAMEEGEEGGTNKKSREQLEAEKAAILSQRIHKLEIDGFDNAKLTEKAKELNKELFRIESERYDLEKRFKEQQFDMMELAERARSINKVGRGGLKRLQIGPDETDKIQERFAGAPAKIMMYSKYERQKDKRSYGDRSTLFAGPQWGFAARRINPQRKVQWDEGTGLPTYIDVEGAVDGDAEGNGVVAGEGEEE